jgi:hypothetical protein
MRGPNGDEMQGEPTGGSNAVSVLANGTAMCGLDGRNAPVIATCFGVADRRICKSSDLVSGVALPGGGSSNTRTRDQKQRDNIFPQPAVNGGPNAQSAAARVESDARVAEHEQVYNDNRCTPENGAAPWKMAGYGTDRS